MSTSVFIRHVTQPGERETVHSIWERHMAPNITTNGDHEAYFYCFDDNNQDVIVVYQQYTNAESAASFLQTPAYLAYLQEVEPYLMGPAEVTAASPIWVKKTS
ncbi:putative quinol monooxygenase [Deinococcus psychrotolerans]|nr:antibiotic biosynthesis monooxygenase [Deinococcus psychrotolerans]